MKESKAKRGIPHVTVYVPGGDLVGLSGAERSALILRALRAAGFRFVDAAATFPDPQEPFEQDRHQNGSITFRQWWPGEPRPGEKPARKTADSPSAPPERKPTRDRFIDFGPLPVSAAERRRAAARKIADRYAETDFATEEQRRKEMRGKGRRTAR